MLQCDTSGVVPVTHFYISDHPDQLLVRHLCGGGRRNRGALVSDGRHRYGGGGQRSVNRIHSTSVVCNRKKELPTWSCRPCWWAHQSPDLGLQLPGAHRTPAHKGREIGSGRLAGRQHGGSSGLAGGGAGAAAGAAAGGRRGCSSRLRRPLLVSAQEVLNGGVHGAPRLRCLPS